MSVQGNPARRLSIAIGISLLAHGLLLSLRFGVPGFGQSPGAAPISVRVAAT